MCIIVYRIRPDEAENVPISLNLENIRRKKEESLLQIRTNPPSPQCFSANRGPNKTTPSKPSKSRLMVCYASCTFVVHFILIENSQEFLDNSVMEFKKKKKKKKKNLKGLCFIVE